MKQGRLFIWSALLSVRSPHAIDGAIGRVAGRDSYQPARIRKQTPQA